MNLVLPVWSKSNRYTQQEGWLVYCSSQSADLELRLQATSSHLASTHAKVSTGPAIFPTGWILHCDWHCLLAQGDFKG